MTDDGQDAFVLRIKPGGIDRVKEALRDNDLIIGWSRAPELLNDSLSWRDFREIIKDKFHSEDDDYRSAGASAGNMWRFIREMKSGDLVVVPHGNKFYIAEVTGSPRHEAEKIEEDSAFRRDAKWLNDGEPIPRAYAKSALQSRMKVRQTCARASTLFDDILDALDVAASGDKPTLGSDLRSRLVEEALAELRSGRINDRGFEELIKSILVSLGGQDVEIVARSLDEGADLTATFQVAETFQVELAVQAKHYQPEPPVPGKVVDQLVAGMEHEGSTHGWVATTGEFSEEAEQRRAVLEEERGLFIELIDGEQLATLIVEGGLRESIRNV